MKKHILLCIYFFHVITINAQEKIAEIKAGTNFSSKDFTTAYYDRFDKKYIVNLQKNNELTRIKLDTNFNVLSSYSFPKNDISISQIESGKFRFLTDLVIEDAVYEAYADKSKLQIIKPDFSASKDSVVFEYIIGGLAKDESLVSVTPGDNKIFILTSSFKSDKLFLTTWSPVKADAETNSFYLPKSNVNDEEEKRYPKEARVKFNRSVTNLTVQQLSATSLMASGSSQLYYTDSLIYLMIDIPYNLGVYLMKLDLATKTYSGNNYFVNTYEDNSSTVLSKHKIANGVLIDSLLIIKNCSDKVLEYYFYNIKTGSLLKKQRAYVDNIEDIVNSSLRQRGTWGSSKEEKEFDSNKKYLRKGGTGMLVAASVTSDSITLTNMSLIPTTGVGGTLLDVFVPLPFEMNGVPMYVTALLPPLGPFRDKLIYFHSKFSIKDFAASANKDVSTTVDKLLEDKKIENISTSSTFLIRRNNNYFIGFYSKESKNIEVYKYNAE